MVIHRKKNRPALQRRDSLTVSLLSFLFCFVFSSSSSFFFLFFFLFFFFFFLSSP